MQFPKIGSLILTMVVLFIGAIVGGMLIPLVGVTLSGIYATLIVACVQILIFIFLGLAGKSGIVSILIGAIVIVIGGFIGGFVANFANLSGWFAIILELAIQSLLLLMSGTVKQGQAK